MTGALGRDLSAGLAVMASLDAALAPVATGASMSAWAGSWTFHEAVDADSILPALAVALPGLAVPEPLRLAVGVIQPGGGYLPLAFRQPDMTGARDEADANAAALRSRYKLADRPGLYDERDDVTFYTLEVE